jgi:antitoxin component of MazEF toxin-antitoxin module
MKVTLRRMGDDLVVPIPKTIAEELCLCEGDLVYVSQSAKQVEIPTADSAFDLESLLSAITNKNRHGEWRTGPPVGNEW